MTLKPVFEAPEMPLAIEPGTDIHAVFRDLRERSPVARNAMGMAIGLRARQLDLIVSDATRQIETETLMLQGVTSGPIFDLRQNSILFSNGDAHRRRRQPLARTFAFKLMEGMRPRASSPAFSGSPIRTYPISRSSSRTRSRRWASSIRRAGLRWKPASSSSMHMSAGCWTTAAAIRAATGCPSSPPPRRKPAK